MFNPLQYPQPYGIVCPGSGDVNSKTNAARAARLDNVAMQNSS